MQLLQNVTYCRRWCHLKSNACTCEITKQRTHRRRCGVGAAKNTRAPVVARLYVVWEDAFRARRRSIHAVDVRKPGGIVEYVPLEQGV